MEIRVIKLFNKFDNFMDFSVTHFERMPDIQS